jgi:hypothetical protein
VLEPRVVEALGRTAEGWLTKGAHVMAPVDDRPTSGRAGERSGGQEGTTLAPKDLQSSK